MTSSRPAPDTPRIAFEAVGLTRIGRHLYPLMMRNIASDGFVFRDPWGTFSKPGCVIAAPSYKDNTPGINQDYIYHWVRDGAITMIEVAAATKANGDEIEPLVDYVNFSKLCQDDAERNNMPARAAFLVDGRVRDWSDQYDGPAIQTLAMLAFFDRLDAATQAVARAIMQKNVDFVAAHYGDASRNLWEEKDGLSFFTRSVQLACLRAVETNTAGLTAPANIAAAIADLEAALASHWNEAGGSYTSILPAPHPVQQPVRPQDRYDPNIDIVCAAIYGAVPVTDTKLLATAEKLRSQWADPSSADRYPINIADAARGVGPMLGRYPGDFYDGDTDNPSAGCHPWALCTANLAELYYRLANAIAREGKVPLDQHSDAFFEHIPGARGATPESTAGALRDAGDAMLRAVVFHSDHLELSEQFDGTSGFEKSVRNLTWSYAAFLSALRARTGGIV